MTTVWPYPSTYPIAYDDFTTVMLDNVDEVIANHPNSLSSSIMELQLKLGLDNGLTLNLGGLQFDPAGLAANPAGAAEPCLWVDNTTGAGFLLTYTDNTAVDWRVDQLTTMAGCPHGSVTGFIGQNILDTVTNISYRALGGTNWAVL